MVVSKKTSEGIITIGCILLAGLLFIGAMVAGCYSNTKQRPAQESAADSK